ncbi:MAG: transposase family protein, partial [Candidatus Brocadiaceae bacterium]|nr:transposase family protein [Candidatus Brocadiaceae bacterium]
GYHNVRVVDGTHISEPGSTGTDWRIHYSIKLFSLQCDELKVTDAKVGETFKRYAVSKGDLLIGDRGYCHRQGIEYVAESGGDVFLINPPLCQRNGKKIHLIRRLRTLHGTQVGDWPVYVQGDKGFIEGRLCAIKKSKADTEKARKKVLQESRRKGRKAQPETVESAGYIFVFTTLPEKLVKPSVVLEIYRGRWQIELVFKRLKSIIGLGHLPKQDPVGAKAWIHGKLFAAFLIEALISAGERFFPWGFPISIEIK